MKNNSFSLLGNAKRRVNFQLTIASCAFAFSAIILGLIVALYDPNNSMNANSAYIAGIIFSIFEFGCCISMLALWVSLYNTLKPIEVVRRLMGSALAVTAIILAYIACVVIVDTISLAGLMKELTEVAAEAINGLVVAFTGISLIVSIVTCVMVHSAANRIDEVKETIKETIIGRSA